MKRLRKLSNQVFEHATTFESFINICNDGAIKPYNEINPLRHSNSLDEGSIYVSKHSGQEFAQEFMSDDKYGIGVYFEISLDEKNLLPSNDFKEYTFPDEDDNGNEYWKKSNGDKVYKEDELTWQDSIDVNDECRYKGSIPLNQINSVTFFTRSNKYAELEKSFGKKLSIKEAIKLKDDITLL